ncbi:hypothetical protein PA25_22150 [Pseudoalteromonas sp. A25]|uniref:winged helix-turn-helix domain-containing protein n=1 Tax=Pseudoalteromonas sp. A25 TaxID=116092 RepID=UPI0012607119|nr:winged helix-turn-helix domain-containing protein [Pseudoalteromonas sp. A25]BBN82230.1 hypothetical protein PA25_22150 [Pseudoalteromonas sp. A25]
MTDILFKFVPWLLDPSKRQLFNGKRFISLEDKQYQLLELLIMRRETVNKDDILSHIWQNKIVTEDTVYVAINGLRRLLNDSAKHPAYIQTVSGQGYCWVGPTVYKVNINSLALSMAAGITVVLLTSILTWYSAKPETPAAIQHSQMSELIQARYIIEHQSTHSGKAIEILQKLHIEHPNNTEIKFDLAQAYYKNLTKQGPLYAHNASKVEQILTSILTKHPTHAKANWLMANYLMLEKFDVQSAAQYYPHATTFAKGHLDYAQYLLAIGQFSKALYHIREYQQLDLAHYSSESVAWVYMMSEHYEAALNELNKLAPYAATHRYYHVCLRSVYEQLGKQKAAFEELVWVMRHENYSEQHIVEISRRYNHSGLVGAYQWLLYDDDIQADIGHYSGPYAKARYAVLAQDYPLSLKYLEQAFEAGQKPLLWVAVDPIFKPLREHKAFIEFISKLNLKPY